MLLAAGAGALVSGWDGGALLAAGERGRAGRGPGRVRRAARADSAERGGIRTKGRRLCEAVLPADNTHVP